MEEVSFVRSGFSSSNPQWRCVRCNADLSSSEQIDADVQANESAMSSEGKKDS